MITYGLCCLSLLRDTGCRRGLLCDRVIAYTPFHQRPRSPGQCLAGRHPQGATTVPTAPLARSSPVSPKDAVLREAHGPNRQGESRVPRRRSQPLSRMALPLCWPRLAPLAHALELRTRRCGAHVCALLRAARCPARWDTVLRPPPPPARPDSASWRHLHEHRRDGVTGLEENPGTKMRRHSHPQRHRGGRGRKAKTSITSCQRVPGSARGASQTPSTSTSLCARAQRGPGGACAGPESASRGSGRWVTREPCVRAQSAMRSSRCRSPGVGGSEGRQWTQTGFT